MAGDARKKVYFDANVFVALIDNEADRAPVVEETLRLAEAGDLIVITSTLSIAEVVGASAKDVGAPLDPKVELRLDSLWVTGGPVVLAEATRRVMVEARNLMRRNVGDGFAGLKPPDAIHLATAMVQEVDEFATYEAKHHERWSTLTGLTVCEPEVKQGTLDLGDRN